MREARHRRTNSAGFRLHAVPGRVNFPEMERRMLVPGQWGGGDGVLVFGYRGASGWEEGKKKIQRWIAAMPANHVNAPHITTPHT